MPNYRAYQLKPDGHIDGVPTIITCDDDQAAIETTKFLVNGKDVELWDGTRLVMTFKTAADRASPAAIPQAAPATRHLR
jgi:hypothetical protein